jgi:hypothetical protein
MVIGLGCGTVGEYSFLRLILCNADGWALPSDCIHQSHDALYIGCLILCINKAGYVHTAYDTLFAPRVFSYEIVMLYVLTIYRELGDTSCPRR